MCGGVVMHMCLCMCHGEGGCECVGVCNHTVGGWV